MWYAHEKVIKVICTSIFIKQKTLRKAELRWKYAPNCEISKQTWPCHNLKRTKTILSLQKSDVKTLIEVLTGYCLIGTHAEWIGRNLYDCYRSCQQPEEEENIEHLLCHCPAYNRTRNDLLEKYILSNLSDIVATNIWAILKCQRSKWFCHEGLEEYLWYGVLMVSQWVIFNPNEVFIYYRLLNSTSYFR